MGASAIYLTPAPPAPEKSTSCQTQLWAKCPDEGEREWRIPQETEGEVRRLVGGAGPEDRVHTSVTFTSHNRFPLFRGLWARLGGGRPRQRFSVEGAWYPLAANLRSGCECRCLRLPSALPSSSCSKFNPVPPLKPLHAILHVTVKAAAFSQYFLQSEFFHDICQESSKLL